MKEMGEILKGLRLKNGMTQEDVGKVLGVKKAAIQKYEKGLVKNIKRSSIQKLSELFNVSVGELLGLPNYTNGNIESNSSIYQYENINPIKTKKFPMLGEIACGEPMYCNEEYESFIEASDSIIADFCLTAHGDSMIDVRIFGGDIVFIRSQPMVENGEIAAVIVEDSATLKRVYIKSDRIILRAENPLFDDIIYEREEMNNVRILGKAVAFMSYVD